MGPGKHDDFSCLFSDLLLERTCMHLITAHKRNTWRFWEACLLDIGMMTLNLFTFYIVKVTEIRMKYFDTIPVASAMCVLKTGFLFVATEFGNQWVSGSVYVVKWLSGHQHSWTRPPSGCPYWVHIVYGGDYECWLPLFASLRLSRSRSSNCTCSYNPKKVGGL